jgi:hypothetical protein
MLVNLPNGKTVDLPFDDYLHIGREGYQYLMANNLGTHVEYPFFASALFNKMEVDDEEEIVDEEEDSDDDPYFSSENFEE